MADRHHENEFIPNDVVDVIREAGQIDSPIAPRTLSSK
jgi:hypothetical protein